jgi:hypothetical protein
MYSAVCASSAPVWQLPAQARLRKLLEAVEAHFPKPPDAVIAASGAAAFLARLDADDPREARLLDGDANAPLPRLDVPQVCVESNKHSILGLQLVKEKRLRKRSTTASKPMTPEMLVCWAGGANAPLHA